MSTNLPNALTYTRILAIPIVVGLMFEGSTMSLWVALGIYTVACITDFLDGYLARALSQLSALGKFLDPIADKLLVASILLMAVANGNLNGATVVAALIILCREILVSGLRESLAGVSVSVPVSQLAKWKTTVQMVALGFLIVGDVGPHFGSFSTNDIGVIGIWLAAALTVHTGADYLIVGLRHLKATDVQQ